MTIYRVVRYGEYPENLGHFVHKKRAREVMVTEADACFDSWTKHNRELAIKAPTPFGVRRGEHGMLAATIVIPRRGPDNEPYVIRFYVIPVEVDETEPDGRYDPTYRVAVTLAHKPPEAKSQTETE